MFRIFFFSSSKLGSERRQKLGLTIVVQSVGDWPSASPGNCQIRPTESTILGLGNLCFHKPCRWFLMRTWAGETLGAKCLGWCYKGASLSYYPFQFFPFHSVTLVKTVIYSNFQMTALVLINILKFISNYYIILYLLVFNSIFIYSYW